MSTYIHNWSLQPFSQGTYYMMIETIKLKLREEYKWTNHRTISSKKFYIQNIIGHYNLSVRVIDLASQTTYVVCVNFIHKWRGPYSLKSTPTDRFFWDAFHGNFIYSQSFCQKSAFRILFCCMTWGSNPDFTTY